MSFTPEQITRLEQKLDPDAVGVREGNAYVSNWHVVEMANSIFGFDGWHRETAHMQCTYEGEFETRGGKTLPFVGYIARVRIIVDGVIREGTGGGVAMAPSVGEAHENAAKNAETDATKRALMTFGNQFGLALYDKEQRNVGREEVQLTPKQALMNRLRHFGVPDGDMKDAVSVLAAQAGCGDDELDKLCLHVESLIESGMTYDEWKDGK